MYRYSLKWLLTDETGGGKSPAPAAPQVIIPPPPQPIPSQTVGQTAEDIYAAQAKYNPLLQQQAVESQIKYAPQIAQSDLALQQQYSPLYMALQSQLFPQQSQLSETLSGQVLQRLQSPQGLTPEQASAQEAIRQRTREQLSRNIRTESNLGGGLFGGRRELREDRALGEAEQGFAAQDVALQDQRRAQTLQELIPLLQILWPQISTPNVPQFGTPLGLSGDALLSAMLGYQRPIVGFPGFAPQKGTQFRGVSAGPFGNIGATF